MEYAEIIQNSYISIIIKISKLIDHLPIPTSLLMRIYQEATVKNISLVLKSFFSFFWPNNNVIFFQKLSATSCKTTRQNNFQNKSQHLLIQDLIFENTFYSFSFRLRFLQLILHNNQKKDKRNVTQVA